jgi:choline dehydrogenase-like flavoprotein
LDWRFTDLDKYSLRRSLEIVGEEVGRAGLGRLKLNDWVVSDDLSSFPGSESWHHMGTTRMSADPKTGVVDKNCRVHGVDNLFIAGSSVFPTGGIANPTLTIVALTLRLADHIKTLMV